MDLKFIISILALMKLRSSNNRLVDNEIAELADEQLKQSQQVKVKWSDFVTKVSLRRPLIVAMVIQMSQQFSGEMPKSLF
jgi:hypothetical protein